MFKRFSTGCAFNLEEMLMNFPTKKLKITQKACLKNFPVLFRWEVVRIIFKESYKVVINDIIDNNVTFWLPLTGIRKCNIHMRPIRGEYFKKLMQAGKWKDLDFLKTNFTGYQPCMYLLGRRTPRIKNVCVDGPHKATIVRNANAGMNYGDSKYDKTIKDYYEIMYEKFPIVPKQDIRLILRICWKYVYLINSFGADLVIREPKFWSYIGNLKGNSLEHFSYYCRKLAIKLRILYRRKVKKWNGYYYFALTKKQAEEQYLSKLHRRGRPRKHFTFHNVMLYQVYEECKVAQSGNTHIFKVPFIDTAGFRMFFRELKTDKVQLIEVRDPLKFSDILVSENEYDLICKKRRQVTLLEMDQ